MIIVINRTINHLSVMIDDKRYLSALADYINAISQFTVTEIRWSHTTTTGTIIVHYTGVYCDEVKTLLHNSVDNFIANL